MSGFGDVVGHTEIVEHLQNAIKSDKVSHAYIFNGEKGSGKKMLATLFATTLQCEKKGVEPCLECPSCKRDSNKNHPDIINIVHEKPNTISIDEIRTQLTNDVDIKPYYGPYKIYIINDAQLMTLQAQNALLKTIEEPPAYAIILLLTNNANALLPTITSRCVALMLKPAPDKLVKNYLMDKLKIPDYQADIDASIAQGNIGKAKDIATSESHDELVKNALYVLRRGHDMELHELVETIKGLTRDKETIYDYLDLFLVWFRDVLTFKATREVDGLVFKNELNAIKERARQSSYEGIEAVLEAIERAKVRLRMNVNFDIVMELLFLTIREN